MRIVEGSYGSGVRFGKGENVAEMIPVFAGLCVLGKTGRRLRIIYDWQKKRLLSVVEMRLLLLMHYVY